MNDIWISPVISRGLKMEILLNKGYVFKNKKNGTYTDWYRGTNTYNNYNYREVSNINEATIINANTSINSIFSYLRKSNLYELIPYEQELRKQKLKELNKNWFQKLPDRILDKYLKIIKRNE